MKTMAKKMCVLACVLILLAPAPLFAQTSDKAQDKKPTVDKSEKTKQTAQQRNRSFLDFFNTNAYAATRNKDFSKEELRNKWKKMLGVDIFMPYFKAKEAEEWVKDRTKVSIFGIRGRAEFDLKQFKYIFKIRF
jgi:type III secretory pathway component EscR